MESFIAPPAISISHIERHDSLPPPPAPAHIPMFSESQAKPDPRPVYTIEELRFLHSQDLITPSHKDSSTWIIRSWALAPPCMRGHRFNLHNMTEQTQVQIPKDRESLATLLYLGFTSDTAQELWDCYRAVYRMLPTARRNILANVMEHLECEFQDAAPHGFWKAVEGMGFTEAKKREILREAAHLPLGKQEGGAYWLLGWLKWEVRQRYWVLETAGRYAQCHRDTKECGPWLKPEWWVSDSRDRDRVVKMPVKVRGEPAEEWRTNEEAKRRLRKQMDCTVDDVRKMLKMEDLGP